MIQSGDMQELIETLKETFEKWIDDIKTKLNLQARQEQIPVPLYLPLR